MVMKPDASGADQARVRAQGCPLQPHFLTGNKAAACADGLPDSIPEEMVAAHQAAAQRDDLRDEKCDQIGQPQAEVGGLAGHCLLSQEVAALGSRADRMGIQRRGIRAVDPALRPHPGVHGAPAGEALPAAVRAAEAGWAGGVDHVVPDLGVGALCAPVEAPIQDHGAADAAADGDVHEAPDVPACAPGGLAHGTGVRRRTTKRSRSWRLRMVTFRR